MRVVIFRAILVINLLAIEFLATTSREIEVIQNSWDKANHFFAFMVLYILLTLSFKYFSLLQRVLLLFLYAVQIEVVQYFIPNRYFSLLDIFADMVGVLIGYLVLKFFKGSFMREDSLN